MSLKCRWPFRDGPRQSRDASAADRGAVEAHAALSDEDIRRRVASVTQQPSAWCSSAATPVCAASACGGSVVSPARRRPARSSPAPSPPARVTTPRGSDVRRLALRDRDERDPRAASWRSTAPATGRTPSPHRVGSHRRPMPPRTRHAVNQAVFLAAGLLKLAAADRDTLLLRLGGPDLHPRSRRSSRCRSARCGRGSTGRGGRCAITWKESGGMDELDALPQPR